MSWWLKILSAGAIAVLLVAALWLSQGEKISQKFELWRGNLTSQFHRPLGANMTMIGKGEPLAGQSHASIRVLEEGVPLALGGISETVAVSGTSGTEIGTPVAVAAPAAPKQLDDVNGLKLGTTLALLTQAYANGGVMARNLANVASELAEHSVGNGPLADAISILRNATPQAGPLTTLVLTTETQRVLALGAPKELAEADAKREVAPAVADSWWQRQLARFVTIRRGDEPAVDRWTTQLRLAQEQLARGNAADAQVTLTTDPLSDDNRLEMLRTLTGQYLDQQGKLTNAINAYAQAYLQVDGQVKEAGQ